MSQKWEEEIIVVPTKDLFADGELAFQGTETNPLIVKLLFNHIERFFTTMRRGHATDDPTPKENNAEINFDFKQPIPYAVVQRGHEVFVYERLAGGGEVRLQNQLSLGVGGHMNKTNDSFNLSLLGNLQRELNEELDIKLPEESAMHLETIGFINDELNEVGKVHLGILVTVNLPEGTEVSVRETDQLKGHWVPIATLAEDMSIYERLEAWSQITIDELYKHIPESETMDGKLKQQ